MERLSNKMTKNNRTTEQLLEKSDRRIAKYKTPENIKFVKTQIKTAIFSLALLFGIKDEELKHIVMPELSFWNLPDGYSSEIHEIYMHPEGITPYRIGSVTGEFLYYTVNPEIFHQKDEICLTYTRSLGQPNPLPSHEKYFCLGNAYINLTTVVEHYCGLFLGQDCCFEPDDSSDLLTTLSSLPEDSDEHHLAKINVGAHYRGMVIAERLFSRYPTEKFKPIIRLSFEEARARLFYMTGVELLDVNS